MTYKYVLILGGEELPTQPLVSVADVERALREPAAARDADRVMVGRLERDDESRRSAGRGVWRASAFLAFPQGGDPDTLYWHRRVRDVLNSGLRQRNFFLWI